MGVAEKLDLAVTAHSSSGREEGTPPFSQMKMTGAENEEQAVATITCSILPSLLTRYAVSP